MGDCVYRVTDQESREDLVLSRHGLLQATPFFGDGSRQLDLFWAGLLEIGAEYSPSAWVPDRSV